MSEHTWVVVMVGVVGLVVVVKVVDSVQRGHPPQMTTKDVQAPPAPLLPFFCFFHVETAKAWHFARLQNNVVVRVVVARVDNVVMFVIVVVVDVVVALRIPTC